MSSDHRVIMATNVPRISRQWAIAVSYCVTVVCVATVLLELIA